MSKLLAGMCWGQAALEAERRPAWPGAGRGDVEQGWAEVLRRRGDDSERPSPAAESGLRY